MKLIARLCLLLLCCFPFVVLAEIPEQIKADFAPISGTIIMPIGEEYLVDLDASVNLQEGDILTLVMPGEKIIDPETKAVLGSIDLAKGYLQVTKVKSGYSYAKCLTEKITPVKGDQVKRFDQIPTRFESSLPTSSLGKELKLALSHLNWLDSGDPTDAELIFVLTDENLQVLNSAGIELKLYPYRDGKLSAAMSGIYRVDTFQSGGSQQSNKSLLNQALDRLGNTVGFGKKDKRLENPGITQGQQLNDGIWVGSNLAGNPVGIAVADFDGDGLLETAVAMEDHLQILRMVDGKMIPVAVINFSGGVHLLSLAAADTDANGTPELYLSANVGTRLSSQVVEFVHGHYQNTINMIPWYFRVVDLPQEGRTLIGQTMGHSENHFSGRPFRVTRSDNELKQNTELPLPAQLNLFNFTTFSGTGNDLLYAYLSSGDYLHATTPGGAEIWESDDYFGGSEVFFYNNEDTNHNLAKPIFISPQLLTLPSGEILVTQNDGFRALERFRKFNKSRVVALKWDGFMLRESWRTADQNGYLADFALADADNDGLDELVMVVKFKQKNLLQNGRSSVVIYELNQ
ncbi:MAG: VCBS repeat-containing protein [Thermodesulfobacteriota bacterium]|nr:VCBS repeat-containing protein [Thermodesulfobacteriota bacterium]